MMFWRRKKSIAEPIEEKENHILSPVPEEKFRDWVEDQEQEVIHDLLVRTSLRLLPGLFSSSVDITDRPRFFRTVDASMEILVRGIDIACERHPQTKALSGDAYYDLYRQGRGGASGDLVYPIFHSVESVADASKVMIFRKDYLAEVNNNVRRAAPVARNSFYHVIASEGVAMRTSSGEKQTREGAMHAPLWGENEPAGFYQDGLASFLDYVRSSSEPWSELVEQTYVR